jgi:hypothetical protein
MGWLCPNLVDKTTKFPTFLSHFAVFLIFPVLSSIKVQKNMAVIDRSSQILNGDIFNGQNLSDPNPSLFSKFVSSLLTNVQFKGTIQQR